MANTISGGTIASPGTGNTLADNVLRWRTYLDDATAPYLWSDQELTSYFNIIANMFCSEAPVIEDATSSMTQIAVVAGTHTYSVSDRIVSIKRAKLSTVTDPLSCVSVMDMDYARPGWQDSTSSGDPYTVITQGLGNNTIRLYPTPSANATLALTICRMQSIDLVYASHSGTELEIPSKYMQVLDHGVYWKAYGKHDADTSNQKMKEHELIWTRGKEELKRSFLKYASPTGNMHPHPGDM